MAWSASVVSGCFYLEPVNRLPKVGEVSWACVETPPCTPGQLHHGDTVTVRAAFDDRDGDESKATLHWRISACDAVAIDEAMTCNDARPYDGDDERPTFTVPQTLDATGGPVQRIIVDLDVTDERGALPSSTAHIDVAPDDAPRGRANRAVVRQGPS